MQQKDPTVYHSDYPNPWLKAIFWINVYQGDY